MGTDKKIIKSFKVQDELNPIFWEEENGTYKLNEEIRQALLNVVEDYANFVDVDLDIDDVTLTGSLSNYNWSDFSDVDLHIIMDFEGNQSSLLKKYLDSRRIIWNSIRDVTAKDFDVEIYVQDSNEPHFASGVYSVLNDEWINEPSQEEDVEIDTQKVLSKSKNFMEKIDAIERAAKKEEPQAVLEKISRLKDKLKKYRGDGLADKGEYSYENLSFKFLRRNEYLKKLNDIKNDLIDQTLTIEGKVSSI
jgi:hypothetical protein|tara:strand:- start:2055 stop:2801 length:747 start_codon:yes stop_codon:yes gene_type:complete